MWGILKIKRNREIIAWVAGGVAAVAAGGWAVFTHFSDTGAAARIDCKIEANASVAACRDISTGSVTITTGAPAAQKP